MRFSTLRRLWSILDGGERRGFIALAWLMMAAGLLEFASVGAIPAFVVAIAGANKVLSEPRLKPILDFVGIHEFKGLIYFCGTALVGIFLMRAVVFITMTRQQANFVARTARRMVDRLFNLYMFAPYTSIVDRNTAVYTQIIMNDTTRLTSGYMASLLALAYNTLSTLALITLLFLANPLVAFTIGAMAGVSGYLFLRTTRRRLRIHGKEVAFRTQLLHQGLHEGLGSVKHVRLRGLEAPIQESFSVHGGAREASQAALALNAGLAKPLFETTGVICLVAFVFILILEGRSLQAIVPTLALVGAVAVRMLPAVNNIISNASKLPSNAPSVTAVADELARLEAITPLTVAEAPEATTSLTGDIVFKNVTYRYPGQHRNALDALSLEIPRGASVAFVGPTGSGKTTAIDVMLGFLPPDSGQVLVDGTPIQDNLAGWQRNIGYIPQTIFLIDASMRANVALGVREPDIDDAAVWRALEDAQLADFVRSLPDGLESKVGEAGVRLSGGQRQRIGIARALYHDPAVLVLDEATAALDTATEGRLMEAIEQAKHGRTLIMIAHRLSTVRNCDCIFFVAGGELMAKGTYAELVTESEEFRQLASAA